MTMPMGLPVSITAMREHHAPARPGASCVASLPPACASRCSSCARWRAWASPWPRIADRTMGRENGTYQHGAARPAFSWSASTASSVSSVLHLFARHIIYCLWIHEYEIIEKANQFIVTSCTYFIPLDCCACSGTASKD